MSTLLSVKSGENKAAYLTIDEEDRVVYVNGEICSLTQQEFCLLQELAQTPNQTVTREELLKEAWAAGSTNGMTLYARRDLVPANAEEVWRASSAALPEMAPLSIGTNGLAGTLSGTVKLAYDDPVNPFLHRYHPLFDNKNGQFEPYDGPVESRNVSRKITLKVGVEGDDGGEENEGGVDLPADASTTVTGSYQEKLVGLRAQEILVKGTFRLVKVLEGELVESEE